MAALEKHLTIAELAELWNLSRGTIRNLFRKRTDVLRITRAETRSKRGYETIRIPESVANRVYAELRGK